MNGTHQRTGLILLLLAVHLFHAGHIALAAPQAFPQTTMVRGGADDRAERYLRELASGPRFLRDHQGVITDRQTGLQWLEGPDLPSSWGMAQEWITALGGSWRTPTITELKSLYLPDLERKGTFGDPLGLDFVFQRNSGYCLWSVERFGGTAWLYDFSRGYAFWLDTHFPGRFDRAVAVRDW